MSEWNDFTKITKSRKVHRCVWCPEAIAIGSSYWRFVGEWQGDFQDWNCHEECRQPVGDCEPEDGICEGPHLRGKDCQEYCHANGVYLAGIP